jgi:hypothetical protein
MLLLPLDFETPYASDMAISMGPLPPWQPRWQWWDPHRRHAVEIKGSCRRPGFRIFQQHRNSRDSGHSLNDVEDESYDADPANGHQNTKSSRKLRGSKERERERERQREQGREK